MRLLICVLMFSLAACAKPAQAPAGQVEAASNTEPMALTFAGKMPCADCPGIETELIRD